MRTHVVLVHSPLVGPLTWRPVAAWLAAAGHPVRVPALPPPVGDGPYWQKAVRAVRDGLGDLAPGTPVVLVAHSNAGLYVPVLRAALQLPVTASVFVDASLPARSGATPVGTARMRELLRPMAVDGVLPRWSDWWAESEVAALFPDAETRRAVAGEQPRLPLAYFEQEVPVPAGWDDHPCAYVRFSGGYEEAAREAQARGWRVEVLSGGHLQQLVDPAGVGRLILECAERAA
ncbi:alpha/beta fold hydrolase [Streptomyces indicus]|uniref:Alpha/beta hydrolase family protein n=1 Tax=Streptomyces indicus TaxID=417292 RepID=A0A1G9IH45_9ACTN|nr:alpha/beta hydrolase [Streptomyces indicus]SDL24223.1 hypothetical protein SAMN05421806_12352 [Streptomyces indicus]